MKNVLSCPICQRETIKRLFNDVRITANIDGEFRKVGGLAAMICEVEGHIFFVRSADAEQVAIAPQTLKIVAVAASTLGIEMNDDQRNWAQLLREVEMRQKRSREPIATAKD